MGKYLGIVEIKKEHYNYKPIFKIHKGTMEKLSDDDRSSLLPKSKLGNIWLYNEKQMNKPLIEDQLLIFEFESNDLEENKNSSSGELNLTGYKVNTQKMFGDGKIKTIDKEKIYFLIKKNEYRFRAASKDNELDFYIETPVELEPINPYNLYPDVEVLLERKDGFLAGPYTVSIREYDGSFIVYPKLKDSKYILSGYENSDCKYLDLSDEYYKWNETIIWPSEGTDIKKLDIISDEDLLENFEKSIDREIIKDGYIEISKIGKLEKLLKNDNRSIFIGINESIREKRLDRLKEILTSEFELTERLSLISKSFFTSLIVKYKDTPEIDTLMQEIFIKNPDLLEDMKDIKDIKNRIDEEEQKLQDLHQKNSTIEEELKANEKELEITKEKLKKELNELQITGEKAGEIKEKALLDMDVEYNQKKSEYDKLLEKIECADDIDKLKERIKTLEQERLTLDAFVKDYKEELSDLTKRAKINKNVIGITVDGFISNKMVEAAAKWDLEENEKDYLTLVDRVNSSKTIDKDPKELIKYLCDKIQKERPQYDKNTIINIAICIFQSFLTVFSGEPGSGKTSICNLIAKVLGLNKVGKDIEAEKNIKTSRHIFVSVERGWTSKRDFIGYYNPLSKSFDKSNRQVYDALKILDIEKHNNKENYPFIITLDEANLSPMEYYWADFMKICDDDDDNDYQINLGDEDVLSIPKTLHFLATINNDHTTEILSPRLIDRAWIITLPKFASIDTGEKIPDDQIDIISWKSIYDAFIPKIDKPEFTLEIKKIYEEIIKYLRDKHILINHISHRTEISIRKYWNIASERLVEDEEYGTNSELVALDYVVAQKILPRIAVSGENYSELLKEFSNILNRNSLYISDKIVKDIITSGKEDMHYYQFFGKGGTM